MKKAGTMICAYKQAPSLIAKKQKKILEFAKD